MNTHFKARAKINRRAVKKKVRFPMKMQNGEIVLRERRLSPDRRHPGLQTHEMRLSSQEFDLLFQAFNRQGQ